MFTATELTYEINRAMPRLDQAIYNERKRRYCWGTYKIGMQELIRHSLRSIYRYAIFALICEKIS